MAKKTVLITGATSGIGYELAKLFARDKYSLILVSRSKNELDKVSKELIREFSSDVTNIAKDLSVPGAAAELFDEANKKTNTIDVLVNNAGFGLYGFFNETDLKREVEMIQLNVVALTELTKLFLKPMIERKSGRILNVASTAAFQAGPLMAVYYATKAYVLHFSEAIANELKGTGVSVTALCPGPTVSGFQSAAKMENARVVSRKSNLDTPENVARVGYDALMKGKTISIPGFRNNFFALLVRFTPRNTVTRIVRQIQEKEG